MPKTSVMSKAIAAAFVVLTASVIGGIITMIILYKTEIATMNPTPRPTRPVTTTALPPVMRLPRNLIPLSYKVFLTPHLYTRIIEEVNVTSPNQTLEFFGNSTVHFQCVERTSTIYLKSMNLAVSDGKVTNENTNKMIGVSAMKTHTDDTNFLEIHLKEALEEGESYSLSLSFKGDISEQLDGMYVSTYVEGVPEYEVSNIIDSEWKFTRFHPTPKMSTYLFAFTVSEFTSTPSKHGHQIALPDLSPAAMENWGLVTYQEGSLLYEEGWFGNLVTMKWWNEVWLNEGFATYMSFFAVDHVDPTFQLKELNILANLHTAFQMDALASSHPLSPPQEYSYLHDFSFKNTDQNDLWRAIQKAEDKNGGHTNVAQFMEPWTKQIGYPVITINTTNGEVYQKHFLFNDSAESSLWWYVPIRVMSNTSKTSVVWLKSSAPEKKDEFLSTNGEWILANINCSGYYRVNYNPENWDRLLTQLEIDPHRFPPMNRGQLIDNAFFMARAKLVEVTLALNSTRFLHKELDFLPWQLTVKNFEYFVLMFDRSEAYFREQVKGLYNSLRNYTDNSTIPKDHSEQHSQLLAVDVACSNGLPECLAMATKMFADWMNSNNTNPYLEYTLDPDKIRLMDVGSTISDIAMNPAGHALAWNFIRAHWDYVSEQ
ncbi:hypothetical protein FQN60_014616 [Etheostoma spectabile]|uniref:Aminopeptidase n=1 Tax=Etheostoma spectabile TaxID=54343 RepID=A0A5J5D7G0_9PERO|nr:hypothetical protein FQN60_014600 [Etheostoma spectabile]KAA8590682.1 hypothetical protein FQN60_014616 [Etheostoma spectabile]